MSILDEMPLVEVDFVGHSHRESDLALIRLGRSQYPVDGDTLDHIVRKFYNCISLDLYFNEHIFKEWLRRAFCCYDMTTGSGVLNKLIACEKHDIIWPINRALEVPGVQYLTPYAGFYTLYEEDQRQTLMRLWRDARYCIIERVERIKAHRLRAKQLAEMEARHKAAKESDIPNLDLS